MAIFPLPHSGRSAVFTALFNLVVKTPPPVGTTWKTSSQFLRQWDEIDATQQPAIFLQRGPQLSEQKHAFGVTKWTWRAFLLVYYRTDGYRTANTYPDQLTDQFLDDLEQTFQTEPLDGRQTLGGLVWHCFIDGSIYSDPGLTDGQGVLLIPITIYL